MYNFKFQLHFSLLLGDFGLEATIKFAQLSSKSNYEKSTLFYENLSNGMKTTTNDLNEAE